MHQFQYSFLRLTVAILLAVQNSESVPSGKISSKIKGVNIIEARSNAEQDRLNCVASFPSSNCSGVLLSARWMLTLSYCANRGSNLKVQFVCKDKAPFVVAILQKISMDQLSLLYLKRESLLSRMFYFELPKNSDDKQSRRKGIVSMIPTQTRELRNEPVFVDECPFKDERIVNENVCLVSRTKRQLNACELTTGLPVVTLKSNNGKTVFALLGRNGCKRNVKRDRRSVNEDTIIGKRITESDVKWIRKARSFEGVCDILYDFPCSSIGTAKPYHLQFDIS